ncbi:MAG TPA: hypothetical protein VMV57_02655 [Terracidiphilus sp.]|nr:hypothetical protein [Terracidiphilus sp.]
MTGRMVLAVCAVLAAAAAPVLAQYPGQVDTHAKSAPVLRAVGVLEWTGEEGKPKFSRLVPVSVFDGQTLEDAGIYLARPLPMAVDGGTEYVLEDNGRHIGLFDIEGAGQQQGAWVGFGKWKPMPKPKPAEEEQLAQTKIDDTGGDLPVLHRKHPEVTTKTGGTKSGAGTGSSTGTVGSAPSAPAPDPDRPTLHRPEQSSDTAGEPAPDPDRPTLTRPKKKTKKTEVGYVEDLPNITDPDRPRLLRGKMGQEKSDLTPTLVGLPPEMHQTIAVSDATNRPVHPWSYSWANADDEARMKAELESMARDALGLTPPPPKPEPKTKKGRRRAKPEVLQLTMPASLHDEQFRVFELAYGSGATLVLTADTGGALKGEKFVTLIAQPDLYGNLAVLLKKVSDGSHLDDSPRMRLVGAVDAMADNRGELLFELRGSTGRQFALYRVLHGQAERLFVTGGELYGVGSRE